MGKQGICTLNLTNKRSVCKHTMGDGIISTHSIVHALVDPADGKKLLGQYY
jgi:hypothetical protein